MRYSKGTITYAQGWVEGQLENLLTKTAQMKDEDPTPHVIASQMMEQWSIVSGALDYFINERTKIDTAISAIKSGVEMLEK